MRLRPLALTTPTVTVWLSSNGLPMAITHSPTSRASELPRGSTGRLLPSILMMATSDCGSVPTTLAVNSRWSARRTVIFSAPSTTWLLVRM